MRILIIAFSILAISALSAWPKSELPDFDGSGFNNSFETAVQIDVLRLDNMGNARGVILTGELGVVLPGRFDTEDYYKFGIPIGTTWKLNFFMKETPDGTASIRLFDNPNGAPIREGTGKPFEEFDIELGAGVYFLRISTAPNTAQGRLIVYDLSVKPAFVPLPDLAGTDCINAQDLGLEPNGRKIEGSISNSKAVDTYKLYINSGEFVSVTRFLLQFDYNIDIIDRNDAKVFTLATRGVPTEIWHTFDPGFYCIRVHRAFQGIGAINYSFALQVLRHGLRPGASIRLAQNVPSMSVNPFESNGAYKGRRQVGWQLYPTPEMPRAIDLPVREWIGLAEHEQWYRFNVSAPGRISGTLLAPFNPVGLEIQREDGVTVALAQTEGSWSGGEQLPKLTFDANITPGRYYVRLTYLGARGPGTSYKASFFYAPSP